MNKTPVELAEWMGENRHWVASLASRGNSYAAKVKDLYMTHCYPEPTNYAAWEHLDEAVADFLVWQEKFLHGE